MELLSTLRSWDYFYFSLVGIVCFVLYKTIVAPLRFKRLMEAQGIKSVPFVPFVGSLPQIIKESKVEVPPFFNFSRKNQEEFGNMYVHYLAFEPRLVILDPEFLQEVFGSKSQCYSKNELTRQALGRVLGNGLVTSEGDLWKLHRHVINPAFVASNIERMIPMMVSIVDKAMIKWKCFIQENSRVQLHDKFTSLTLDVIGHGAFGGAFNDPKLHNMMYETLGNTLRTMTGRILSMVELIPIIRSLPLSSKKEIESSTSLIHDEVQKVIKDRMQGVTSSLLGKDLLDMLLEGQYDEAGKEVLSVNDIRDHCVTFVLAGHETTSNLLSWFFYEISKDASIWAMLKNEIDTVLNGNTPTAESLKKLVLLDSVIKETLRVWPPVTILNREALCDHYIGNERKIFIPKGTNILALVVRLHTDPLLWENPDSFEPTRFLRNTEHGVKRHVFQNMSFGCGKRMCIGSTFALIEAKIIIIAILQRFRFTLCENQKICPEVTITMRPKYGVLVDATIL